MSVMGAANRSGYLSGEQRFAAVMIAVSLVLFILIRRAEIDILPALKREDSFVGSSETASPFRDDGRPLISRTTSGRSVSPRRQLPHPAW